MTVKSSFCIAQSLVRAVDVSCSALESVDVPFHTSNVGYARSWHMVAGSIPAGGSCQAVDKLPIVQADKEQSQFEAEWRKLGSIIDQDKRNRELIRQREMEERDRRTQEACPSFSLLLKCR